MSGKKREIDPESQALWDEFYGHPGAADDSRLTSHVSRPHCCAISRGLRDSGQHIFYRTFGQELYVDFNYCPGCGGKLE